MVILILVLYSLADYNYFGEFKYLFKWKTLDLNYYSICVVIRIIIGLLIGGLIDFSPTPCIIAAIYMMMTVLTVVKRPFADVQHTIRTTINYLIAFTIFVLYSLIGIQGPQGGRSMHTKFPLIIVCLLYVVVFVSLGYVIRQFIMDRRTKQELE